MRGLSERVGIVWSDTSKLPRLGYAGERIDVLDLEVWKRVDDLDLVVGERIHDLPFPYFVGKRVNYLDL